MIRLWTVCAMTIMAITGCATGGTASHLLWQIDGQTNRIYLLGSVHLLRAEDYPLPELYERVYANAEVLLMELDMDDLNPSMIQQEMMTAGTIADGGSLRTIMGEEMWAQASSAADTLDVRMATLDRTEPWLAALMIIELKMMKLGFDPALGIEFHFVRRAASDNKEIHGLESLPQQIAFFDELPLETQKRFLLKTIEDAQTLEGDMDQLIAAWKSGDTAMLETELIDGFAGFPDVYQSLVANRNRTWTGLLENLLDDQDDYLVIVGALHLIGEDSVVRLLREKGYRVKQL